MKTLIILTSAILLILPVHAESFSEKRWRLRAEILERELELSKIELRETAEPTPQRPADDFVNAHGARFASSEKETTHLALVSQEDSSSFKDVPAHTGPRPQGVRDVPAGPQKKSVTTEKKSTSTTQKSSSADDASSKQANVDDEWVPYRGFRFGYQVLKPSTRIYFDTGHDDPGELDLFKDGNIGVTVDFLTLSWDYGLTQDLSIGVFTAGGISSSTSEADHSAILVWSAGLTMNLRDLPFAFEAGILQGVSASETLNDRTDTALFVGISLTKPTGKMHVIRTKHE